MLVIGFLLGVQRKLDSFFRIAVLESAGTSRYFLQYMCVRARDRLRKDIFHHIVRIQRCTVRTCGLKNAPEDVEFVSTFLRRGEGGKVVKNTKYISRGCAGHE